MIENEATIEGEIVIDNTQNLDGYALERGPKGEDGSDATINGYNTITINGGNNIRLLQNEDELTIENTYDDTIIKNDIEALEQNDVLIQNDIDALEGDVDTIQNTMNTVINNIADLSSNKADKTQLITKQDKLVSGTNIKTINNNSIVGSGNIEINSGVWGNITGNIESQTDLINKLEGKQDVLTTAPGITIQNNQIGANFDLIANKSYVEESVAGKINYTDVVNNVTSSSTTQPLSANQGKILNDRIDNIAQRGRYLALWNCVTGLPLSNPSGYPYAYHTGDYFIVSNTGSTNYVPNGSSYIGVASTTVYSGDIKVNDTIYYDGTVWMILTTPVGGATVLDVDVDGESIVSGGVAHINLSDYTKYTDYASETMAGVIKAKESKGLSINDQTGVLSGIVDGYNEYLSRDNDYIISKGTIETVLICKGFLTSHQDISGKEDNTNKVTSISASSTNAEYPSAKAVYDYIQSLDASEVEY